MEEAAINAVRDLLVSLLKDRNWCAAETVGRALKILVEWKQSQQPTLTTERCEIDRERR